MSLYIVPTIAQKGNKMTEELNQELQTEEFTDNIENAPVTKQDVTKTV